MALYGIDFALAGSVLINIFWSFYAGKINAPVEQRLYLTAALPVSLVVWVFYFLTIRLKIMKSIKRRLCGEDVYVPHHGILFMGMIVRILMMGALGIQAYLALNPGGNGIAAGMSTFEAGVDIIFVIAIMLFVRLDKMGAATNISVEEFEKLQLAEKENA